MRSILLFALLVAGCSRATADLATVSQARSLGAEWAMVNDQEAMGKLTPTYASTMRKQLRQQLESCASSAKTRGSRYAIEIQALLHEPDNASPQELNAQVAVLKRIEDDLESA